MNKITLRPAIAMIELIFAIVIMGIVLISAPMLISTATKSTYVTIQQEAINVAASQISMIMGYHWDSNTADERYLDPILKVSSTDADPELDELNTTASPLTGRRAGTSKESYRTFIREDGTRLNATSIPSTPNSTKDDIGDFNGETTHLVDESESAGAAGDADNIEKNTIDIETAIKYIPDTTTYNSSSITFNYDDTATTTGTTNIKNITVKLTSTSGEEELEKTIKLHAFSCNIGGYKLEEKDVN